MKCPNCDGPMVPKGRQHVTKIGSMTVTDGSCMVPTCQACGTVSLSQDELAGYERRAVRLVLTTAEQVSGEVLKFARKSLGLRQKDIAGLLDTNEQQISRWEHEPVLERRLCLAIAALLYRAEQTEGGGLEELGTRDTHNFEVVKHAC